ncbi:hypothetical protein HY085_00210, partial [Candidatus Gottesmanbacteria bacterium]|nr:hypothetical protein [Candidatus Gottesmanbacteria bacterium]
KCLYDRNNVNYLWLKNNSWIKDYLPRAYKMNYELSIKNYAKKQGYNTYFIIHNSLFLLELIAFLLQYLYQKPKQTNEKLGWGFAFFHPRNLSEKIVADFEKKFQKLNLTEKNKRVN